MRGPCREVPNLVRVAMYIALSAQTTLSPAPPILMDVELPTRPLQTVADVRQNDPEARRFSISVYSASGRLPLESFDPRLNSSLPTHPASASELTISTATGLQASRFCAQAAACSAKFCTAVEDLSVFTAANASVTIPYSAELVRQ